MGIALDVANLKCHRCGHPVFHKTPSGIKKARTKMIIVKSDDVLALVCPCCKSDVIVGVIGSPPDHETSAASF